MTSVNNVRLIELEPGSHLVGSAVLQLCYNRFSGSIPRQLGSLQKLSVLALQYNLLTGAIPASLGDLASLKRLDLSYNSFFGSIPARLANASNLEVLDVRNNTLSGFVPTGKFLACSDFDVAVSSFSRSIEKGLKLCNGLRLIFNFLRLEEAR